jgi:hypothetical protein
VIKKALQGSTLFIGWGKRQGILLEIEWPRRYKSLIRNICDALIVTQDKSGKAIPSEARKAWSSAQYDHLGVYNSYDGTLAIWGR